MIFALIILLGIVAPVLIYRRGGKFNHLGAVAWFVAIGLVLYALTGPYGAFMLVVYALGVFVIVGMTVLLAMAWKMIHFR